MRALVLAAAALVTVWTKPNGDAVFWAPVRHAGGLEYVDVVVEAARRAAARHDLDPTLLVALTFHESGFHNVETPFGVGVMQVNPRHPLAEGGRCCTASTPGCVEWQIEVGARALRQALDACDGDEWGALGFYRFGRGRCVRRARERSVLRTRLDLLGAVCAVDDRAGVSASARCAARARLRSAVRRQP